MTIDNKNTVEETVEAQVIENDTATEVKAEVLDENGNVVVKPATLFTKIGSRIDGGITKVKGGVKKHWKKGAIIAGAAAGITLTAVGAMAVADLDKKLSDPALPEPEDPSDAFWDEVCEMDAVEGETAGDPIAEEQPAETVEAA